MSSSGTVGDDSQPPSSIDGENKNPEVIFDMDGRIIFYKNPFKRRCLELAKSNVGLVYDTWKHVPDMRLTDVFNQLKNEFTFPLAMKDNILKQMGVQWRTWKRTIRAKHFEVNTKEAILAKRGEIPNGVLVSMKAWNTFVEREATPKKLAEREQGKDNRSKKTDAHYLGRTSYAELEAKWPGKRKPDRTELYVEARKNPKTNEINPGAAADVDKLMEIRNNQDEGSNASIETDALTQHFGKDQKGRVRGVGSTVALSKLKATEMVSNEPQKVQAQLESNNDTVNGFRQDLNQIMTILKEKNASTPSKESRGSHAYVDSSEKSNATESPCTMSSDQRKFYNLKSLDGRRDIAVATIEKVPAGAIVHHRPMLPFEVKVSVIKVKVGMETEPLWQGPQADQDTIGGTEGYYLVWPRFLVEEFTGDISI